MTLGKSHSFSGPLSSQSRRQMGWTREGQTVGTVSGDNVSLWSGFPNLKTKGVEKWLKRRQTEPMSAGTWGDLIPPSDEREMSTATLGGSEDASPVSCPCDDASVLAPTQGKQTLATQRHGKRAQSHVLILDKKRERPSAL